MYVFDLISERGGKGKRGKQAGKKGAGSGEVSFEGSGNRPAQEKEKRTGGEGAKIIRLPPWWRLVQRLPLPLS